MCETPCRGVAKRVFDFMEGKGKGFPYWDRSMTPELEEKIWPKVTPDISQFTGVNKSYKYKPQKKRFRISWIWDAWRIDNFEPCANYVIDIQSGERVAHPYPPVHPQLRTTKMMLDNLTGLFY